MPGELTKVLKRNSSRNVERKNLTLYLVDWAHIHNVPAYKQYVILHRLPI